MTDEIQVRNPWSGEIDGSLTEPSDEALVAKCAQLKNAQRSWYASGIAFRLNALRAFGVALQKHRETVVAKLEQDTGRVRIANIEFEFTLRAIERTCQDATAVVANSPRLDTGQAEITAHQQKVPYGLMLNIAPWNFPMLLSLIDVFPALAAGNAAIIKPSEVTPRWVDAVQAALDEVPELSPVLGLVVGAGHTGARLVDHADIVCFTGSVATGRKVAESAAANFIPALLELGGNDPAIVLKSADIEAAAEKILFSATTSSGQACQSLERVYVDENIADEFTAALVVKAHDVSINYPDLADGFIGPFIFEPQANKVRLQLQDAADKGANILTGGEIIDHGGKWLEATVIENVNHQMQVMTEETFGPVIPVMRFTTVDEAIELANDTHYGLSASVFAGTPEEGREVAHRINAGAVSINEASLTARIHTVAHESFALSGMGRSRFGDEAVLRYLRTKAVFEPC